MKKLTIYYWIIVAIIATFFILKPLSAEASEMRPAFVNKFTMCVIGTTLEAHTPEFNYAYAATRTELEEEDLSFFGFRARVYGLTQDLEMYVKDKRLSKIMEGMGEFLALMEYEDIASGELTLVEFVELEICDMYKPLFIMKG